MCGSTLIRGARVAGGPGVFFADRAATGTIIRTQEVNEGGAAITLALVALDDRGGPAWVPLASLRAWDPDAEHAPQPAPWKYSDTLSPGEMAEQLDAAETFARHDPDVDWPGYGGGPVDAIAEALDKARATDAEPDADDRPRAMHELGPFGLVAGVAYDFQWRDARARLFGVYAGPVEGAPGWAAFDFGEDSGGVVFYNLAALTSLRPELL